MTYIENAEQLTGPFNAALSEGRLTVQECNTCGELIMYPKYRCPGCFGSDLGWKDVSGKATLLTYTVLRFGAPSAFDVEVPYGIGIVRLDEGPQLTCRLHANVEGGWDHYRCDAAVEFTPVSAEEIAERPAAWFSVAEAS